MASLEFGQVGSARLLVDLRRQTLFHNARLQNYILYFYVHRKIGSKIYTIRLNYKPCNVVYIVIKLQFAIKNFVYVKSIC